MRALAKDQALEIYRARYWTQSAFDMIEPVHRDLAGWLLDTGINMGPATAGKMLQRWLSALNNDGTVYPDLTVDGACGAMRRHTLATFLSQRGTDGWGLLLRLCRSLQATRYLEIAEANPSQERFAYGGAKRVLG